MQRRTVSDDVHSESLQERQCLSQEQRVERVARARPQIVGTISSTGPLGAIAPASANTGSASQSAATASVLITPRIVTGQADGGYQNLSTRSAISPHQSSIEGRSLSPAPDNVPRLSPFDEPCDAACAIALEDLAKPRLAGNEQTIRDLDLEWFGFATGTLAGETIGAAADRIRHFRRERVDAHVIIELRCRQRDAGWIVPQRGHLCSHETPAIG